MESTSFRAIVPAGGAGTRLWPTSRRSNPKFLHDFTGSGSSLLQTTVDRLNALADEVLVVTGDIHAGVVQEQVPACGVVTEPSPKDSMPAIALGAAVLARRYPREDLVVGSFAADHVITRTDAFEVALRAAIDHARRDEIVTIGITPTHPATGYGYIRPGEALDADFAGGSAGGSSAGVGSPSTQSLAAGGVHRVAEFIEKPDAEVATRYVEAGYLWNAGMYIARASVLLGHLRDLHPDLASGIDEIADAWDGPDRREVVERVWPTLTGISIDHAIAEPLAPSGQIAVVPADLGWSDVGDWNAIGEIRSPGEPGALTVLSDPGAVIALNSPGAVVDVRKQVVIVGIPGAVVIETSDAILVTTRENAQAVKDAVDELPGDLR